MSRVVEACRDLLRKTFSVGIKHTAARTYLSFDAFAVFRKETNRNNYSVAT